jgi:hypothetical protein
VTTPKKDFDQASPGLVTRAERDHRIAARPRPKAELHLTPHDGYQFAKVRQQLDDRTERRIKHIDERLKEAREKLEKDRAHSVLRGRAKQAFDRGR